MHGGAVGRAMRGTPSHARHELTATSNRPAPLVTMCRSTVCTPQLFFPPVPQAGPRGFSYSFLSLPMFPAFVRVACHVAYILYVLGLGCWAKPSRSFEIRVSTSQAEASHTCRH